MITLKYRDEIGDVEASFELVEEYNKFKTDLISKYEAKKAEAKEKAEKEAKEFVEKITVQWSELKSDAKALVAKAKSFGVGPNTFVELIRGAMFDAADDRCLPACDKASEDADANEVSGEC